MCVTEYDYEHLGYMVLWTNDSLKVVNEQLGNIHHTYRWDQQLSNICYLTTYSTFWVWKTITIQFPLTNWIYKHNTQTCNLFWYQNTNYKQSTLINWKGSIWSCCKMLINIHLWAHIYINCQQKTVNLMNNTMLILIIIN